MHFDDLKKGLGEFQPAAPPYSTHQNTTHNLVSIVAYLIGVNKAHFREDSAKTLKQSTFQSLETNKNARIIRNLCIIRTGMERHYSAIRTAFRYDVKNIGSLPEYIPSESVQQLTRDGITIYKSRPDINDYLITINRELSNRVSNVQTLFPDWIKWDYIRELFLMPNGFKPEGLKAAGAEYNKARNGYPFQCYINWVANEEDGNILYSDEKFVKLLYERHEDFFEDGSLVRDASNMTTENIYDFLAESNRAIVVVDCENSDPIKLAAVLSSLSPSSVAKIHNVLLFDSNYTTSSWSVLSSIAELPLEHITVPRLNEKKSQVDMTLATRTCKEVYQNNVDSVILVSSDSDYWALIQTLSDIDFLVMVEREKCGHNIREALKGQGIFYCFIDDFCTGASYAIKITALIHELQSQLDQMVSFNTFNLFDNVLRKTWVQMTPKEKDAFYNRYVKTMRLTIDAQGKARIVIEPQ